MENSKLTKRVFSAIIAATMVAGVVEARETRMSVAGSHTVFINSDGTAFAMGDCSTYNNCGTGSIERYQMKPVYTGIRGVKSVSASYRGTSYVKYDGSVIVTDNSSRTGKSLQLPGKAFDAASDGYSVYILVETASYMVGDINVKQGDVYKYTYGTNIDPELVLSGKNIIQITASASTTIAALDRYGDVYTWGNALNMLGDGAGVARSSPTETPNVVGFGFRSIDMSGKHVVAVQSETNKVFAWGDGTNGKVGTGSDAGSNIPNAVPGMENVRSAYATFQTTAAITWEGKMQVVGWHNLIYQGTGYNRDYVVRTTDYEIPVIDFAQGSSDAQIFMNQFGEVWGWGGNRSGKLGIGNYVEQHDFVKTLAPDFVPEPEIYVEPVEEEPVVFEEPITEKPLKVKSNKGHGNNADGVDSDNPGQGNGGPNSTKTNEADNDEGVKHTTLSWKDYAAKQAKAEQAHKIKTARFLAKAGTAAEKREALRILSELDSL